MRSWLKLVAVLAFIITWCYLVFSGLVKLPEFDLKMSSPDKINWKSVDLFSKSLPKELKKDNVDIETGTKEIEGIKMFYRKAVPPGGVVSSGQSILLLHGKNFKSETWQNLGTIHLMAAVGHRVIAVDLPSYGETKEKYKGDRSKFILSLIKSDLLSGTRPVLISPSMSGEYSVKFVAEHSDLLSGYVPVAPVETGSVPRSVLQNVKLPTIILVGENDNTPMAKQAPENLGVMPNSKQVILHDAGHAAYLNQPDLYHKLLYNFMELLKHDT